MVSSFCRYELPQSSYRSIKRLSFLMKRVFILSFIMPYAENIGLRDCMFRVFANRVTFGSMHGADYYGGYYFCMRIAKFRC